MTPWTVAHQVPLSVGFSKQEYWSGLPFPSPGLSIKCKIYIYIYIKYKYYYSQYEIHFLFPSLLHALVPQICCFRFDFDSHYWSHPPVPCSYDESAFTLLRTPDPILLTILESNLLMRAF